MRLIDADRLLMSDGYNMQDCSVGAEYIISAPTVDAVAVVRCKDCIYYGEVGDCKIRPYDGRFNVNYFCADGEK